MLAFFASIALIGIVVALNNITAFMLLAAFGFILSQDLFTSSRALLCLLCFGKHNRIARFLNSFCKRMHRKTFVSYSGVSDIRLMSDWRTSLISLSLSALKGAVLLALSLVCVYFTSTLQDAGVLITVFSGIVMGLAVMVLVSDSIQKPYFLGIFRNPLFPKFSGDIANYKPKRRRLLYASVPQRIILQYGKIGIVT